jgi:hypothetical protein
VDRGRPAAAVPEGGPGASGGGPAAARSQRRGGAAREWSRGGACGVEAELGRGFFSGVEDAAEEREGVEDAPGRGRAGARRQG